MSPAAALSDVLSSEALASPDEAGGDGREIVWAARQPEAVVRPRTVDEVATVMRWASREGVGVLPVASGSRAGPVTRTGRFVALTMERLSGVEIYEPADLTITAGAGTSFGAIDDALRGHDQWVPLDPPSVRARSVGGLVAAGASGPLSTLYGELRNHVLGATVVTGDGRTLRLGGRVVKNVAGFDLLRPVVGSRGTLAVVTSACLRAFPEPPEDRTLVLTADSAASLVEAAQRVGTAPILPASVVLASRLSSLGGRAALVVRLHGAPSTVEADQVELERHVGRGFERIVDEAGVSPGRSAVLDEVRDCGASGETLLTASARPSQLGVLLEALEWLGPESLVVDTYGGRARVSGGSFDPNRLREARAAIEAVGGALSGSPTSAEQLELTKRLEKIFDPEGVLWPCRA